MKKEDIESKKETKDNLLSIEIGKEEGIEIGKRKEKIENIRLMMDNLKLSFVEAMKAFNIKECDYDIYRKELNLL